MQQLIWLQFHLDIFEIAYHIQTMQENTSNPASPWVIWGWALPQKHNGDQSSVWTSNL